jgi:putative membrane protein
MQQPTGNRRIVALAATVVLVTALVIAPASAAPGDGTTSTAPQARALDDPTIIAIFDAANTVDMETGALAAKRGASKEVREFGAMLVRDHKGVRQMGRDLAGKLKVTPTPPRDDASAKAHAAAMTSLRGLRGDAFDHAFLQHEVAFHKSVIDAVTTTLLPAIQNAELKALVVKVAPAFEGHRLAAATLDQKLTKAAGARGAHGGRQP